MKKSRSINSSIRALIPIVLLILIWQIVSGIGLIPKFMLPSPLDVINAGIKDAPLLIENSKITLFEAFIGLITGVSLGFMIAIVMDRYKIIYDMVHPLIVLTQTVPTVALAPLLVLWMGYGILPK